MNMDAATSKSRRTRAHVLAVPFAGLVGHMNPLMSLCQKLAAEGVLVTFAYSQAYYERDRQQLAMQDDSSSIVGGQSCANNNNNNNNIRVVGVCDGLSYQEILSPHSPRLQCQAASDMEDHLVELAQTYSSCSHAGPITCIIADTFIMCASSVAQRLGIPHVAFWTQSAASFAAHIVATQDYSTLIKALDADAGGGTAAPHTLITCIPGCPPLKFHELPTFLQSCDPTEFFFSCLTKCFQIMRECPHILLNTYQELECESMEFISKWQNKVCAVGPLLPILESSSSRRFWAVDEEDCMAWLDMQRSRSVLFVSFGSLTLMSEEQLTELAAGLEASGCPFLMVVRDAMMKGQAPRFPIGFQENLSKNGRALFVQWAPQLRVLAHMSIGGFLTHCGWNSTLEAMCNGLPLLGWPNFVDQMMNCRCIVDSWGIGTCFEDKRELISTSLSTSEPSIVSRHLIEEKVRYLMDPTTSTAIRERANELGMDSSKAIQEDGSSHLTLMSFVSWLQEVE